MTLLHKMIIAAVGFIALPISNVAAGQAVGLYVTDAVVTFDPANPPGKVKLTAVSTSKQSDGTFYNSPAFVTWSSDTTSICTVPSAGNNDYNTNKNKDGATATADVVILTPGQCIINVQQDAITVTGVGSWNGATASNFVEITAKSGTSLVSFPQPADIKFTDALSLQATVTFRNAPAPAGIIYNFGGDPTPSVCTVAASGLVTPRGLGTCTVRAYYGGSNPYYPGVAPNSPTTRSFKILSAKDAITLSTPSSVALDAGPVILVAATSSGTPVMYSASGACANVTNTDYTKSPPVVSAVVQPSAVGACSITATSSASANFSVADSVTRTIQITGQTNKITFPPAPTTAFSNPPPVLQASASSGGAVTYALAGTTATTTTSTGPGTSSTTSTTATTSNVCTVATSGAVTFVAPGLCSVSASQAAQGNYAAATPVTMSFTVSPNQNTITFAKPADKRFSAGTLTITATATSGTTVTYSSGTASACTVAPSGSNGIVTFVSTGTCSITASQAAVSAAPSTYFAPAAAVTQVFQITPGGNSIAFPQPADTKLSAMPPALAAALPATAPAGLSISYASQTAAICNVTPAGTLTFKAAGYCSITASQVGASPVGLAVAAPASVTFQVLRGDNVITFNPAAPASVALATGSLTLVATSNASVSGPSAAPVSFISTTSTICTVTPVGNVALVARGACLISASHGGDANYVPATTVPLRISVTSGVGVVTFAPLAATPISSPAPVLTATSSLSYAISYSSTTASTCSVTKSGANSVISLTAPGTCSITASDGTAQASQSFQITAGVNAITFPQPTNVTAIAPPPVLSATATSGQPVSYATTTAGVCSVTPAGVVTLVAGGTCAITASQAAVGPFAAAAAVTRTFTVTGSSTSSSVISFPALADTAFTSPPPVPAATSASGLPASYTTTTPSICRVNGTRISFISGGTCSITASQAGNATTAAAAPVTRTFAVLPAANTISFPDVGIATLPSGVPTLTVTASSGLPITYTATTSGVCTVTPAGAITLIAQGTCSITAAQPGNPSYVAAAPVSRSFTVRTGGNVITFPQPASTPLTGLPPALAASASSGLAIAYASTTVGVCKVTPAGVISYVAVGTCAITASQPGQGAVAAALPVTRTFQVQQVISAATTAKSQSVATAALLAKVDTVQPSSTTAQAALDEQRLAMTSAIGSFVARRNDLVATSGPDANRQIDRLVEANGTPSGSFGTRLALRSGLTPPSRLDGVDANDAARWRSASADLPAARSGTIATLLALGIADDGGASGGGGSAQIGGLRLNGATEGGMRFGFATSLRDMTRTSAETEARKAAAAGYALSGATGPSTIRANPLDLWVEGKFASYGDPGSSGSQDGTLAFGADYVVNPAFLLGTMVQFDSVSQRAADPSGSGGAKGTGWMAGPYVTLRLTPDIYWQARGAWGQSNNTLTGQQAASSGFQSTTWLASTTVSGRWSEGAWSFRPSASVSYLEDVTTSSSDTSGVAVPTVRSSLGQAKAGPEVGYRFELGSNTVIEPRAGLQLIWNFAHQSTAAGFGPVTSETAGTSGVRGRLELGVRASTIGGVGLDLSGSYDGIGASDYGAVTGRAEVRVPLN